MRFIGLTEGLKLTKNKMPAVISVISVVLLSILSFIGISALLEADAAAARSRHEQEITDLIESSSQITDDLESSIESSKEESSETTEATSGTSASQAFTEGSSSTESIEPTTTTTGATTTTIATTTTSATTRSTTRATTTTTETTVGEKTHNAIVYVTKTVNLRKGPGTSYESIRLLHRGDRVDVIGVTTNGWYKTIKGNYVIASCTQSERINTPTPTPKPATPTPKPTKKPTKTPTKTPTKAPKPTAAPNKDNMTLVGDFKITFYIPFQGNKTASGTTCTMGRTIAASKKDFPIGTVLYIENDPLGGDGFYTVEDRGVSSGKIDIFVDSTKYIPSYGRTTRKVYIVNK